MKIFIMWKPYLLCYYKKLNIFLVVLLLLPFELFEIDAEDKEEELVLYACVHIHQDYNSF